MRQPKQLKFFKKPKLEHGGRINAGKRKIIRPLDSKRALHVVLRSSRARGKWSMLNPQNKNKMLSLLEKTARANGVKVYQFANVGNHLHLVIKFRHRDHFKKFLRSFAGRAAALITGAKKGHGVGKFWDTLAYTRIVEWGRDFISLCEYVTKNLFEGQGGELLTAYGYRRFQISNGLLRSVPA